MPLLDVSHLAENTECESVTALEAASGDDLRPVVAREARTFLAWLDASSTTQTSRRIHPYLFLGICALVFAHAVSKRASGLFAERKCLVFFFFSNTKHRLPSSHDFVWVTTHQGPAKTIIELCTSAARDYRSNLANAEMVVFRRPAASV